MDEDELIQQLERMQQKQEQQVGDSVEDRYPGEEIHATNASFTDEQNASRAPVDIIEGRAGARMSGETLGFARQQMDRQPYAPQQLRAHGTNEIQPTLGANIVLQGGIPVAPSSLPRQPLPQQILQLQVQIQQQLLQLQQCQLVSLQSQVLLVSPHQGDAQNLLFVQQQQLIERLQQLGAQQTTVQAGTLRQEAIPEARVRVTFDQLLFTYQAEQERSQQQQEQRRLQRTAATVLPRPVPVNEVKNYWAATTPQRKKKIASQTKKKSPPFPLKLHEILANPQFVGCIRWNSSGKSFRIVRPAVVEEVVIPLFFKHSKFASFMRQINGWAFKRIISGEDKNSYWHEFFLRDNPQLCLQMTRLKRGQKVEAETTEKSRGDDSRGEDSDQSQNSQEEESEEE